MGKSPYSHVHVCGCGAILTCTAHPDRCPVPVSQAWACPSCEQDQFDQFVRSIESRTTPRPCIKETH